MAEFSDQIVPLSYPNSNKKFLIHEVLLVIQVLFFPLRYTKMNLNMESLGDLNLFGGLYCLGQLLKLKQVKRDL